MTKSKPNHFYFAAGPQTALFSAALFGISTPLAKLMLGWLPPLYMASLLYLGMGLGLGIWSRLTHSRSRQTTLTRDELPYLVLAISCGGVLALICLMFGLQGSEATTASLLLNLEGVFTALLAWFCFKENCDNRIVSGMMLITIGGIILSFSSAASATASEATGAAISPHCLLVALACLAWAADNNFTRNISSLDVRQLGMIKGLVAGSVNFGLAMLISPPTAFVPQAIVTILLPALILGFLAYGLSLVLYIRALRLLGAARTSAYFSTAPFLGALVSIFLLHEGVGLPFFVAAFAMSCGVYLHLSENHEHEHSHEALEHEHEHEHDSHHNHDHNHDSEPDGQMPTGQRHSHKHRHEAMSHSHPHFPDIHHRHIH